MEERFYTIDQVAETFSVTRAAVYKWMKAGQLKYVLVGAHRRIPQSAINAFIKEGKPEEDRQIQETQRDIKVPGLALAW
jgi:excisionase family DNA binding protein